MKRDRKQIKRILLISPFQVTSEGYDVEAVLSNGYYAEPPLGLAYIAAVTEKEKKYVVEIYDAHIEAIRYIFKEKRADLEELFGLIENKIKEFNPDLIGISCMFHTTYRMAHKICEIAKKFNKEIITVMGGSYPNTSFKEALGDKNLDYVLLSEGELSFPKLIDDLNKGRDVSNNDGIVFIKDGNLVHQLKTEYIQNLDSLPLPSRHLLPIKEYNKYSQHAFHKFTSDPINVVTMTGSRGCPFNCAFCQTSRLWGRKLRYRSAKKVVEEIETLVKDYGATHIALNDDNITYSRKFMMEFTGLLIEKNIDIKWLVAGGLYARSLDDELVERMVKSGHTFFNLAVESGSKEVLKRVRKPVILDQMPDIIKMIRKYDNTYVTGFFVLGFPFETKEQINQTLDISSKLDLDWRVFSIFQPFPGTDLYDECIKDGFIDKNLDFEKLSLRNAQISTPNFDKEYLQKVSYLANLKDNFLNNRNLAYGDIDQAINDFKWVIKKVPKHGIAHYCLGRAYLKKGLIDDAAAEMQKAKSIVMEDEKNKSYFKHFKIDLDNEINKMMIKTSI